MFACGAGETKTAIAQRMGLTGMTVGKWRRRYRDLVLEGLHDELRPGRPRTYEDDSIPLFEQHLGVAVVLLKLLLQPVLVPVELAGAVAAVVRLPST